MKYKRPEVITREELAEGVFAASGAASTGAGSGTNVVWSSYSEQPEHNGDPHWIRYYETAIADVFNGGPAHCSFTFTGPIRHGGIRHQEESSVQRTATTVECDIPSCKPGEHNYRIYVCCDPEYYPDALNLVSASIVPK